MLSKEIIQVCKKFNIIYMEMIDCINLKRDVYGSIEKLPYKGLYTNLLDDENKIKNLIMTVEKDNEPYTWRQGEMVALVYKNNTGLVCMFYITEKKGLESYQLSQCIFEYCKKILD